MMSDLFVPLSTSNTSPDVKSSLVSQGLNNIFLFTPKIVVYLMRVRISSNGCDRDAPKDVFISLVMVVSTSP
jgi:hypothetical protein